MKQKLKRILKEKNGFTLMETIVTMILIVILAGGVALLTAPAMNIYVNSTDVAQAKLITNSLYDEINGELSCATSVALDNGSAQSGYADVRYQSQKYGMMTMRNDAGRLAILAGGVDIAYDRNFYLTKAVSVSFYQNADAQLLDVEISVYDAGGERINTQRMPIRLLNATV